jgi:hypothetical protein
LVNGDHKAWSTTPSLSWSALDLGSALPPARRAAAQDGVLASYEKTVLAALETENALQAYGRRQQRLVQVAAQADAARRSADLAGVRYREGADDVLTLLEAQRSWLAADDALAAAQYDVNARSGDLQGARWLERCRCATCGRGGCRVTLTGMRIVPSPRRYDVAMNDGKDLPPASGITQDEIDLHWMRHALALAERAQREHDEIPVGAVLVGADGCWARAATSTFPPTTRVRMPRSWRCARAPLATTVWSAPPCT